MKKQLYLLIISAIVLLSYTKCSKKNNAPELNIVVSPTVGSTLTSFQLDASKSSDNEDDSPFLKIRVDWDGNGDWESDWTPQKNHVYNFNEEGDYQATVEIMDSDGETTSKSVYLRVSNSINVIPPSSPFSYNVGINYETFTVGRDHRIIKNDLDTITNYFKLIKSFHCAGVGTTEVVMDSNQYKLVQYLVDNIDKDIELAMGTNNSALATGGYGKPFGPGLMTTKEYTDSWIAMVINAFGSKENMLKIVKTIMLGNEIDLSKPGTNDPNYHNFYAEWVPKSFDNLSLSMKEAGLGSIPITTIIANYPFGNPTVDDSVQTYCTRYIVENWKPEWNNGHPFLMFNQYTANYGKTADFGHVINYIDSLDYHFNGIPGVTIGETGYSAEYGAKNQVTVTTEMFKWLESQYSNKKLTIPLFIFMSFDRPNKGTGQLEMGIFKDDASNKPLGLKDNMEVPSWVKQKKG